MQQRPAHTRVPNQIFDLILPRLPSAEQACLLYVLRRTYGFGGEGRKQWDRISLSQFVRGTQAGEFYLDLGTGLSRSTAIRALTSLEERGLLRVNMECPVETVGQSVKGCGWRQGEEGVLPGLEEEDKLVHCPRCRRTLSKTYQLRTLTPGFVRRFLTSTDTAGRVWAYHPELERFYIAQEVEPDEVDTGPPLEELLAQVQFRELVEAIMQQAAEYNKTGEISEQRKRTGFIQPTLDLQNEFPAEAVKYGLQQVVNRKIAQSSNKRGWKAYARACCVGYIERTHGNREAVHQAQARESVSQVLAECAELNRTGKTADAKRLLDELLQSSLESVAEELGDRTVARNNILEAFQKGIDDYQEPDAYMASVNYLPDWQR